MTRTRELSRREFLRLTGASLSFFVSACGEDTIGGGEGSSGGDGSSSSGGGAPTTSGGSTGGSSGGGSSSEGSGGDGTSSSSGEAETSSGETGEASSDDSTTGEQANCRGESIEFDPDGVAEDLVNFPRAVLAGAMRATSTVVCSHTLAGESSVLRVWQPGERAGQVWLVYEVELVADEVGALRHRVEGLCPGRWYRYGFFAGGGDAWTGRSVLGEFRTALAEDAVEALTVAISACNHIQNRPWPALLTTADEYYDVFLHLGDMAYNDSASDLAAYRASWHSYLLALQDGQASGISRAFGRSGLYATLDDHEITNNFNPETIAATRFEAAMQSYFEALPLTDEVGSQQVWRSWRWGRSVEFFVLDCRTERRPSTANSQAPEYLSLTQMAWLKEQLLASPCHFKVILNSVPITDMPDIPWDFAAEDRWEGYALQRFELLEFIHSEQLRNVWFVSGDLHVCFVGQIQPGSDGVLGQMREVAVTGGNTNPLGDFLPKGQFPFGSSQPHALLMTFDPAADEVLVRFVDPDTGQDAYAVTLSHA